MKVLLWPAKLLALAFVLWLLGFALFVAGALSDVWLVRELGIFTSFLGLAWVLVQLFRMFLALGGLGKWYVYPGYTKGQPRKPIFILGIGFSEEAVAGPFFTAAGARKWIESSPL